MRGVVLFIRALPGDQRTRFPGGRTKVVHDEDGGGLRERIASEEVSEADIHPAGLGAVAGFLTFIFWVALLVKGGRE